jgi:hypothetical protein
VLGGRRDAVGTSAINPRRPAVVELAKSGTLPGDDGAPGPGCGAVSRPPPSPVARHLVAAAMDAHMISPLI